MVDVVEETEQPRAPEGRARVEVGASSGERWGVSAADSIHSSQRRTFIRSSSSKDPDTATPEPVTMSKQEPEAPKDGFKLVCSDDVIEEMMKEVDRKAGKKPAQQKKVKEAC